MGMSRTDADLEQRAYYYDVCVSSSHLEIAMQRPGVLMNCNIEMARTDWMMTPLCPTRDAAVCFSTGISVMKLMIYIATET